MDAPKTIQLFPKDDDANVEPGELAHLSALTDYQIEDPAPDIRGWTVKLRDGQTVGKVDDLVVDTDNLVVRYFEMKVAREFRRGDDEEWMLIPISVAHLDDADDVVMIHRLPSTIAKARRSRIGKEPLRTPTDAEALAVTAAFEPLDEGPIIDAVEDDRPFTGN
ncbi:MAG TPA: PRC-barrel domain-containing protein [Gemmatimonadaceae bacterium]|nr:PRC-barrel domain-containing protein [Gemmatimonadaceae bacterium]